ncbi:MAG: Spy/CpxP family protein refolding chaperone [bacterium]|nr:Spy/CpxP family protein refolding chaperone [bacterium]
MIKNRMIFLLGVFAFAAAPLFAQPGPGQGPGFGPGMGMGPGFGPGMGMGFGPGGRGDMIRQRIGEHMGLFLPRILASPRAKELLQLTDEQVARIDDLTTKTRQQIEALMPQMRDARKELEDLLKATPPDKDRILEQVEVIGYLQIELTKIEMSQRLALREILTPEQIAKLEELMRNWRGPRGPGGPFGPGGLVGPGGLGGPFGPDGPPPPPPPGVDIPTTGTGQSAQSAAPDQTRQRDRQARRDRVR